MTSHAPTPGTSCRCRTGSLVLQLVRVLGAIAAIAIIAIIGDFDPLFVPGVIAYVTLVGVAEQFRRRLARAHRVVRVAHACCSTAWRSRSRSAPPAATGARCCSSCSSTSWR